MTSSYVTKFLKNSKQGLKVYDWLIDNNNYSNNSLIPKSKKISSIESQNFTNSNFEPFSQIVNNRIKPLGGTTINTPTGSQNIITYSLRTSLPKPAYITDIYIHLTITNTNPTLAATLQVPALLYKNVVVKSGGQDCTTATKNIYTNFFYNALEEYKINNNTMNKARGLDIQSALGNNFALQALTTEEFMIPLNVFLSKNNILTEFISPGNREDTIDIYFTENFATLGSSVNDSFIQQQADLHLVTKSLPQIHAEEIYNAYRMQRSIAFNKVKTTIVHKSYILPQTFGPQQAQNIKLDSFNGVAFGIIIFISKSDGGTNIHNSFTNIGKVTNLTFQNGSNDVVNTLPYTPLKQLYINNDDFIYNKLIDQAFDNYFIVKFGTSDLHSVLYGECQPDGFIDFSNDQNMSITFDYIGIEGNPTYIQTGAALQVLYFQPSYTVYNENGSVNFIIKN